MPDLLKLHFIVLLWGCTGILGKLIDLPSVELVLYRGVISAVGFGCVLLWRGEEPRLPWREAWPLLATGGLIGLHWTLFFLSAKLSNVSVSVIALSTTALWTALLEPLMVRGKPWRRSEVLFGVLVIGAVAFLFDEGSPHLGGFLVGVGAALVGTVFSIFNGWFAGRWSHHKISLHEMMGTALVCALCLPLSALGWFGENEGYDLLPSGSEWIWLMVLSLVCTVYAFGEYIELLERISVYTINLANNLEPLYGILLAAWLFAEWAELDGRFYLTSAVIVGVVGMHSWWEGRPSYPSSKVKGS